MSTTTFSVRIDTKLKSEVEKCLNAMGLNMSIAIAAYLHQIVRHQAIPFQIAAYPLPSRETQEAIEEGERIARDPDVKGYHDMKSLKAALNS